MCLQKDFLVIYVSFRWVAKKFGLKLFLMFLSIEFFSIANLGASSGR